MKLATIPSLARGHDLDQLDTSCAEAIFISGPTSPSAVLLNEVIMLKQRTSQCMSSHYNQLISLTKILCA